MAITAATATRLITKFGRTATLTQTAKIGDEWAPALASTSTEILVVDIEAKTRDEAGTLAGQTMRGLMVSTSAGVTPDKGDKITLGGKVYEVRDVEAYEINGGVLTWKVMITA